MTENCSFLKIIVFCFVAVIFSGQTAISQVGIGTTDPNANAALDIESTNQGILIPRVELVNLTNNSPLTGTPVEGILVFNTATSGSGVNAVTPGFYYHNGNTSGVRWVRFMGSDTKTAWELSGNSGTTENDFLGTTDNRPLRIRANNTLRFEFTTGGHLRASYPGSAATPTYAWANKNGTGIFSPTNTEPNIGFSTGGLERFRIPNSHQVLGMNGGTAALPFYSWNGRTNTGMYSPANNQIGFSTGAENRFLITNSYLQSIENHRFADGTVSSPSVTFSSNTGMGFSRPNANTLVTSTNGSERMRVMANGTILVNDPTQTWDYGKFSTLGNFNSSIAKGGIAVITSENLNQRGTAIAAGVGGNLGILINGSGMSSLGYNTGFYTSFDSTGDATGIVIADSFINGEQWHIGVQEDLFLFYTYRKIVGPGTVNTIVRDINNKRVLLSAPEAPENLFMDYGVGKLNNGRTYVKIDPNLTKNIIVNEKYPLKVFIQVEGETKGVYVTNKSAEGFEVVELENGRSNISFSYSIVAQRGDEVYEDGRRATYQERWADAPKLKETSRIKSQK